MSLFLPPSVAKEIADANRRYEAEVFDQAIQAYMGRVKGVLDEFTYELQKIDPRLEMMRASDSEAWHSSEVPPGYYFVVRHNDPPAPPSIMPVQGPNGEFREPDSRLFEELKKNDLWNPATKRRAEKQREQLEEAAERHKARERADRQRELYERYLANTRTQVSMLPGWSQNVAGKRGRR